MIERTLKRGIKIPASFWYRIFLRAIEYAYKGGYNRSNIILNFENYFKRIVKRLEMKPSMVDTECCDLIYKLVEGVDRI